MSVRYLLVEFMFSLLLQMLKMENFEKLYKFINSEDRFECCKGAVFSSEDLILGEKFLKEKFPEFSLSFEKCSMSFILENFKHFD